MNQPTEDRIKRLEEGQRLLKEEVKQLREERTEEIKVTRVEVASADVLNQLKALEQGQQEFKQEADKRLDEVQEDTNIVKIQMEGARADILRIGESQADLRDRLIEHSEDLKAIKDKQDAHTEILGQIMNFGERIESTMATKDDVTRIEKTQAEQGDLLKLILAELRKPREE